MSLEEAEAEMEKKHNSHFGGTGRLSQAIARNEGVRQVFSATQQTATTFVHQLKLRMVVRASQLPWLP